MNVRIFAKAHQTRISAALVAAVISLFSLAVHADNHVKVENGYIRATIPGTNISSAYMVITNHSMNVKELIGATSNISPRIEIHEHQMSEGMMKMRQRESIVINMHDAVTLQPSGLHLMIFELNKPLKVGDNVELTLQFKDGEQLPISLPVESIKRKKKAKHAHNHH
ncbi:copper chaperone PCu(A)C [Thalassotalea sediminis]|uniref:copper chaperone PCu(A)C n=1 Tax=Thalassotalea sediminis TaxID=1759089 RepID=UPI002574651C|nr:copper chaperone PCu(A)C [Thalassotalea sediminis]